MKQFYVIKLGGELYVATKAYGLFQDTTTEILNASRFNTYEEAEAFQRRFVAGKLGKKLGIGGTIEGYVLMSNEEYEQEVEYVNSLNIKLVTENNELVKKVKNNIM